MEVLEVGKSAPDFILKDQHNNDLQLSVFKGKWVVLYFYPKDRTPYCTQEARDFSRYAEDFGKLGAVVIGVSPDSTRSHYDFMTNAALKHYLLSDEEKRVSDAYGSVYRRSFLGRETKSVSRDTYLIDPSGRINFIWKNVKVLGHAKQVLERIKSQKLASRFGVS